MPINYYGKQTKNNKMEMTTKHFVIFGAGILAGYLLVDYLRKNPMGTSVTTTNCPQTINCMPTGEGGTMHPYCTNMPPECVGITNKAV
jgi:hypothetical protein